MNAQEERLRSELRSESELITPVSLRPLDLHAADATGPKLAPVPGDLAAIDADMAEHVLPFILNQHPQIGMGKDGVGPWQLCDDFRRPDRVV